MEIKAHSTVMACWGPESASKRATGLETEIKAAQSSQVPNSSAQEHLPRAHSAEVKLQIDYVLPDQNLGFFLSTDLFFKSSYLRNRNISSPTQKNKPI